MQSPEDLGRISCALELIRELKARKSGPANPGEIMFCLPRLLSAQNIFHGAAFVLSGGGDIQLTLEQ